MFVHNGLAIRSVSQKLADVACRIGQVAGATEVVSMEEEPVALVGAVTLIRSGNVSASLLFVKLIFTFVSQQPIKNKRRVC